MPRNSFPHSLAFRILGPILLGIVIYLLVLMLFDSLSMLEENFFSREVLFTIIVSFIFSETNRGIIEIFERSPVFSAPRIRIGSQIGVGLLATAMVVSACLYVYFTYFVGFTVITTELITFNAIYLLTSLFYHLHYFSLWYLDLKNEKRVALERDLQSRMEAEISAFTLDVNPGLLYDSLEIVLRTLREQPDKTDTLVAALAEVYRYRLKMSESELVSVSQEVASVQHLIKIFSAIHPVRWETNITDLQGYLVPGTLLTYVEQALSEQLLPVDEEYVISLHQGDGWLELMYPNCPRLNLDGKFDTAIRHLERTFAFYGGEIPKTYIKQQKSHISIPMLVLEEEIV